jgi:hypothetical protein
MSDAEGKLVELRRKVLRRFYEPLLLLNALGQVRGERIKPAPDSDLSGPSHRNIRRSFADGIAYISAYDKGPDYVMATALEKSPQGTVVWLAANAEITPKVFAFLQSIWDDLGNIAAQSNASERRQMGMQIFENLLTRVIAFNEARLQLYCKMVQGFAKTCLSIIRETGQPIRKSVATLLNTTSISRSEPHLIHLIQSQATKTKLNFLILKIGFVFISLTIVPRCAKNPTYSILCESVIK